jgi:hypothetical protein
MGQHVPVSDARAFQGIAHFLEMGGKPSTLAVIVGDGTHTTSAEVRAVLAQLNDITADEIRGLDAIVAVQGTGAAGTDGIVGIGARQANPRAIFAALGEIEQYATDGRATLVRLLSNESAALRKEGDDALQEGLALLAGGASPRLVFERRTIGGVQMLRARDASVTRGALRSYTSADLDTIVARNPSIAEVRTLGAEMVQGTSGSFFEKWARKKFLDELGKQIAVPRLRVYQHQNGQINFWNKDWRSSDGFLTTEGEVWDMKFMLEAGQVDTDQLRFYKSMQKAGFVATPDGVVHDVKSINYLFQDRTAAEANAFVMDSAHDVRVWYVDDHGTITQLH